jgi:hypothetical protein
VLLTTTAHATTYGQTTVVGTKGVLFIDSPEGRLYDASNYVIWEEDGIDIHFLVNTGYTLDYAYLYFGDGTGQVVSANTTYTHVVGKQVNFTPSLVLVFTDQSVEEILAPTIWEAFPSSEPVPSGQPTSYTPPMTAYTAVNTALSNNGRTVATEVTVCRCGITQDAFCRACHCPGLTNECNSDGEGGCVDVDHANCPKKGGGNL